jgi:glycosyltransferase involved in cell wall biosynthesis
LEKICFVGNEIAPTTAGGAGALVHDLVLALLRESRQVILVLNLSKADFKKFETIDRLSFPNAHLCRAYQVSALCSIAPFKESDFISRYIWESACYDFACQQVYEIEKPDLFEFVDYCGSAYNALCSKVAGLSYQNSHLAVRIHGPLELIDRYALRKPLNFDSYIAYSLERGAFRLAETVLFPTPSMLAEYYSQIEPRWLGNRVYAQPLLSSYPKRRRVSADAKIALYYGRLLSVKGVDLYVEAIVRYLVETRDSQLQFYLVGYDSMEPPDRAFGSYQAYLECKIPTQYRERFHFTGFMTHSQLEELLPEVKFAVFPSSFESYCFAAHELRLCGIPLILSDIPAFRDNFQPGIDALFFDGRVESLVDQIQRMDTDDDLRDRLSKAPTPQMLDRLEFYRNDVLPGWIDQAENTMQTSQLLVCIIDDEQRFELTKKTLSSLSLDDFTQVRIVFLQLMEGAQRAGAIRILGEWYSLQDESGNILPSSSIKTAPALLILRAGDIVNPEYLRRSQQIIERFPNVSYVNCWKWIQNEDRTWLQTFPFPVMSELAGFEASSFYGRTVMRTPANVELSTLFDQNANQFGEIAYLWKLDNDDQCGIQLPHAWVTQQAEKISSLRRVELTYLILQQDSMLRKESLSWYLAVLANAYPFTLLPLQATWAERSGLGGSTLPGQSFTVITKYSLRQRVLFRLQRGGKFSQQLGEFLLKIWLLLKGLRNG